MSKRKPTLVPSLKPTSSPVDNTQRVRKVGIVPHQSVISVQNVPDYSTPAGAAMANEEMRRLRMGLESLRQQLDKTIGEQKQFTPLTQQTTPFDYSKEKEEKEVDKEVFEWALTLKNNGIAVDDPLVVQCINYVYKETRRREGSEFKIPIKFELAKQYLEEELKTQADAVQIDVIANAVTYFYDWYMFRDDVAGSITVAQQTPIQEGIFKGLNRRTISLLNDELSLEQEFKYYGTSWFHEGEGETRGWHSLPLSWRQPAIKFVLVPSETDEAPVGSVFIISPNTTYTEWVNTNWDWRNWLLYKFAEQDSFGRYLKAIKPNIGDTISVLFPENEQNITNCKPKLYQYANKNNILKWWNVVDLYDNVGDKTYVHEQTIPSSIWIITHNLNKKPSITVVDTSETVIYGEVKYIDGNTAKIKFKGEVAGKAYLN